MKKIIALLLALCLTLSLCACGASAPTENLKAESSNGGYDYMADGVYDSVEMESPAEMPEAGASGNTATEDFVYLLEKSGIETGLDLQKVIALAKTMRDEIEGVYSGHQINIRDDVYERACQTKALKK